MLDWADDSDSQIGCMTCSATAFVGVGKHCHVEIIFGYGGVAYQTGSCMLQCASGAVPGSACIIVLEWQLGQVLANHWLLVDVKSTTHVDGLGQS